MSAITLSEFIGTVSSELPFYSFSEIPPEVQSKGQSQAMGVAGRWLEAIFNDRVWPPRFPHELVHPGGGGTCDAVQHRFRAPTRDEISVFQTRFIVLVKVVPGYSIATGLEEAKEAAERLFRHDGRLNLAIADHDGARTFGQQVSPNGPEDYDWLDTLLWWTDGNAIYYRMLKRTGPGQCAVVSSSLEANHPWFATFETRRTS